MSFSGIQPDAVFLPLLGPLLGEGKVRCVYEWVGLTDMVTMVGKFSPYASNLTEWDTWRQVIGTRLEPLFAGREATSQKW
jgi:hypothetical protein